MTIDQENEESVNPLFNKMDALLARHRGNIRGKEEDILPVLTDVAEDQGPIPVLTEVAMTPASSLMFDPTDFLSPQPVAIEPVPVVHVEIQTPKKDPEFLDLPLLDLESLLRERAPFGPGSAPQIEPLTEEPEAELNAAPVDADADVTNDESNPAAATSQTQPDWATEASSVDTFVDEFHQDQAPLDSPQGSTLHWEEADEVNEFAHPFAAVAEALPAAELPVAASANNDAPDWSPVAPWWTDETPVDDAETLAASVSVGYVMDEPPVVDNSAVSVDWQADTETPLELDLDAFREEDSAEPELLNELAEAQQEEATPAIVAEPPPVAALSWMNEAAISEMTASVAAHLAVDISTEVEQLTRRHFAQMMQTLYGEALTRMIDQVGMELEARLAPRIDALVREELQTRGLTNGNANPATDQS